MRDRRMVSPMTKLRRVLTTVLVAALAFCPLGRVCMTDAAAAGGAESAAESAGHGTSHHAASGHDHAALDDSSTPIRAAAPDGCAALQHCAPFTWGGGIHSAAVPLVFAELSFPRTDGQSAFGIDATPEVPPPKFPS
jgi:hypothetical protein